MPRITSITPIEKSGLSKEVATAIFEQISLFANYGFNKSHAAAYAAIAFQTAYLKTHHPEAFFAAAMNLDLDEIKNLSPFAAELKARKIPLWQPSINSSHATFTPLKLKKPYHGHQYGIAYALSGIRGVGRAVADAIVAERVRGGRYSSLDDFLKRVDKSVPKNALQALAKAGAFDLLGVSRSMALARVSQAKKANANQFSLFDLMDDAAPETDCIELSSDQVLDNEFDVLGHFMSAHPLDYLRPSLFEEGLYFSNFVLNEAGEKLRKARMAAVVTSVDVRQTKAGDLMAVLLLSDPDGTYEALAFKENWTQIRALAKKKARLVFDISVSPRGDEKTLIIEGAYALKDDDDDAADLHLTEDEDMAA